MARHDYSEYFVRGARLGSRCSRTMAILVISKGSALRLMLRRWSNYSTARWTPSGCCVSEGGEKTKVGAILEIWRKQGQEQPVDEASDHSKAQCEAIDR